MSKRMKRAMVCGQMVDAPEGDYFVVCSLDSNHVMLRSRMPYHIVKCLKQHPNHNKVPCPYDFTEYIDKEDFPQHILTCEFKRSTCQGSFETAKMIASGKCGNIQQTPFFHEDLPPPEEDWGDYDAMQASKLATENKQKETEAINGSDEEEAVGVGRGVSLRRKIVPPKKGMSRGEVLKRLLNEYWEMNATGACSPSTAASAPRSAGQFDD